MTLKSQVTKLNALIEFTHQIQKERCSKNLSCASNEAFICELTKKGKVVPKEILERCSACTSSLIESDKDINMIVNLINKILMKIDDFDDGKVSDEVLKTFIDSKIEETKKEVEAKDN